MLAIRLAGALMALAGTTSAASVVERAIRHFGGQVQQHSQYEQSVAGLNQYLRDSGVRRMTAEQMTRPHHRAAARKHGYDNFVPKSEWWPRGAALALLTEALEDATGERVTMRNWWRPDQYNRDPQVGGAERSDHVSAHAVDIDYTSARSAERAQRWLEELRRKHPWLRLSLGSGPRTTHVGIASPLGSRSWTYRTNATANR
ncbi:MAG TPA: D-Ala-D-Ala carboxypeptidase family metallohydrolase [Bryobacteraceae bacterium]|nr:D-Ala-D-Ala carboxypeptidase family metallohydrolase [Bryobacteraceae bacterium]